MDISGRVSALTVFPNSDRNISQYTPIFTQSIVTVNDEVPHRGSVTQEQQRQTVIEIINKIFDERTGLYTASSSVCSTPVRRTADYDVDNRLKYWKEMLQERKRIARNIHEKIGKPSHDVLFNRSVILDQEKEMVKRVLDFSDRMNPLKLKTQRLLRMREYCNQKTCLTVNEINATLPKPEREKHGHIEIIGLPTVSKKEQFGKKLPCKKSPWLDSKILEEKVETNRSDIERVVEFYPDIENLEIVGENVFKHTFVKHNPEIEFINEDIIKTVSTETSACVEESKFELKTVKEEPPIVYGLKVNEYTYIMTTKRSAQFVEIDARFDCYPYENVVKRVLTLENIGQKILNIEFVQRNFYAKVKDLLRPQDEEFVLDTNPFRLVAGERRDICVLFQPRKVNVLKQQYIIKVDPQFFCRKTDAIVLKLNGRCKPPVEYVEKINGIVQNVIEKSNMKMMSKLGKNLGSLTPLIKPPDCICPYKRALDEREVFEQFNPDYICERYHDLELLKEIYQRIKKPREPAWDFKLKTLFHFILRLDTPDRRALVFNEAWGILENMKGKPMELETKIEISPERERSRFIYVRGIICAAIEEWEDMAVSIEEGFLEQAMKVELAKAETYADSGAAGDMPTVPSWLLIGGKDEEKGREFLAKRIHRQKAFRDSMYVQTFTHLCNFVEDIVSVIESTELF